MQNCAKCGLSNLHPDYETPNPDRTTTDAYCKACRKVYSLQWRATPEGRASSMWSGLQRRIFNRDGRHASYARIGTTWTKDTFLEWAVPAIKEFMFSNPGKVPSLDRKVNLRWYEPNNCRIIDWAFHRTLRVGNSKKGKTRPKPDLTLYPVVPYRPAPRFHFNAMGA